MRRARARVLMRFIIFVGNNYANPSHSTGTSLGRPDPLVYREGVATPDDPLRMWSAAYK